MRLIDADLLLKDSFYEFWQDCSAITPTGEYLLSKFRKLIKIAETVEPEQRWIPCSERLPEDGVHLVYAPDYRGGSSSAKEWHDGVMFSKCKNGKWSVEHGYYSRPNCVIAWMPLPEPYAERKTT